jgi:hypothetical protein
MHSHVVFRKDGEMMIKEVGGTYVRLKHTATCHCGQVELEPHLSDGIVDPRRCNCSYCGISRTTSGGRIRRSMSTT